MNIWIGVGIIWVMLVFSAWILAMAADDEVDDPRHRYHELERARFQLLKELGREPTATEIWERVDE